MIHDPCDESHSCEQEFLSAIITEEVWLNFEMKLYENGRKGKVDCNAFVWSRNILMSFEIK